MSFYSIPRIAPISLLSLGISLVIGSGCGDKTEDTNTIDTGVASNTDTSDTESPVDTSTDTSTQDTAEDTSVVDTATVDTAIVDTGMETGVIDTGMDTGAVGPGPNAVADFSLPDTNPSSPTVGQSVSPRDYLEQVSGWYFIKAT